MKVNRILDYIIIVLLSGILVIDSINGFLLRSLELNLQLSQIYKLVLQLLFLIRLFSSNSKSFIYTFFLIFPLILSICINEFFYSDDYFMVESMIKIDKFYFTVISFFYFTQMLNSKGEQFFKDLKNVLNINLFILIANLVVGIMGLGYNQYQGGIGTRGFFYAGNEMAALIIVLFTSKLFFIYNNRSQKVYMVYSLLYLVLAIYSSTKVAMVGILLSTIFIPSLNKRLLFKNNPFISINKLLKISLVFVGGILFLLIFVNQSGLIDRWNYFYSIKFNNSIFSFLLSGRNLDAKEMIDYFYRETGLVRKLIGVGASGPNIDRIVEMDLVDVVVNYGVIGFITIYSFFSFVFAKIFRNYMNGQYSYASLSLFVCLLLLPVSIFTGHIIFSAMAGIFISLVSSLAFYKE